jgi:hypothetical protein
MEGNSHSLYQGGDELLGCSTQRVFKKLV